MRCRREELAEVEIHEIDDDDEDIGLAFVTLLFLFWILFGLIGLKLIEIMQLTLNRLMGWVASPQDKDLHMRFFLCTLHVWLKFVSVSYVYKWFRMGTSDGESDRFWPYYKSLIQRFGLDRFLRDANVDLLDESRYGQLYRKRMRFGDEPLMLLCVYDATPGPNGKPSRYFLRVPPYMRTAKEAVAWTFGLSWRDYSPSIET